MSCARFREELSAMLDGEAAALPRETVRAHLDGCAGCRQWQADALALRRSMVVRPAADVPDRTADILAAAPRPARRWTRLPVALGVVAVAQCALALAQVFGLAEGMHGMRTGAMTEHLTHEGAAWNLAVGIGLAWAALRRRAAGAQLPLLAGFVLVLAGLSAFDVLAGQVTPARLGSHGLVLLGLVLLFLVRRAERQCSRPDPLAAPGAGTVAGGRPARDAGGPGEDGGYGGPRPVAGHGRAA